MERAEGVEGSEDENWDEKTNAFVIFKRHLRN